MPHRSYRDGNPKPELLCALTPFEARCGFRLIAATLQLLDALPVRGLERVRGLLRREGAGALPDVVRTLLRLDPPAAGRLVQELYEAAGTIVDPPPGGAAATRARGHRDDSLDDELRQLAALILELASRYPHDPGVAVATLLNHVTLAPGQAVYLPAGVIHAYLGGMGVEIMANSDNVLRGGLTAKHVDVAELLTILRADPDEVALDDRTIGVVLGVEGSIEVAADDATVTVAPGGAVAIPARATGVRVAGRGQAFLATSGS